MNEHVPGPASAQHAAPLLAVTHTEIESTLIQCTCGALVQFGCYQHAQT